MCLLYDEEDFMNCNKEKENANRFSAKITNT